MSVVEEVLRLYSKSINTTQYKYSVINPALKTIKKMYLKY